MYSNSVYHTYWVARFVLSGLTGRLKAVLILANSAYPCADAESFVRGGPNNLITFFFVFCFFLFLFFVDEGIEKCHYKWAINHRPASEMPFKWRFAGGLMMAQH